MKKRINILLALIMGLICYSCQQDITKQNKELILGEWIPVDEFIPENQVGYQFTADNQCENKVGFYSYYYPDGVRLDHYGGVLNDSAWFCDYNNPDASPIPFYWFLFNVNRAYGNKTIYSIKEDTLQIFDLAKQKWQKYQINFEDNDKLVLSYWHEDFKYHIEDLFIRKSYPEIDETPIFEQFVFYTSFSCYTGAKCLLIRRDGLFFSYNYFESDQFFIGKIRPEEFIRIENQFKQANIWEVTDSFHIPVSRRKQYPWYDTSISMITSDQKIYTIKEPLGKGLPNEFEWGYLSGIFLPDVVQELKPYYKDNYPSLLIEIDDFSRIHISGIPLYVSERFYLGVLLCYAKEVESITFDAKYDLIFTSEKKAFMKTDGRYFRYTNQKGKEITLDIGFNFIEANGLDQADNE